MYQVDMITTNSPQPEYWDGKTFLLLKNDKKKWVIMKG